MMEFTMGSNNNTNKQQVPYSNQQKQLHKRTFKLSDNRNYQRAMPQQHTMKPFNQEHYQQEQMLEKQQRQRERLEQKKREIKRKQKMDESLKKAQISKPQFPVINIKRPDYSSADKLQMKSLAPYQEMIKNAGPLVPQQIVPQAQTMSQAQMNLQQEKLKKEIEDKVRREMEDNFKLQQEQMRQESLKQADILKQQKAQLDQQMKEIQEIKVKATSQKVAEIQPPQIPSQPLQQPKQQQQPPQQLPQIQQLQIQPPQVPQQQQQVAQTLSQGQHEKYREFFPEGQLNRKGKKYLEPNLALIDEHRELAQSYKKYLTWYNANKDKYNEQPKYKTRERLTVEAIINQANNKFKKSQENDPPHIIDQNNTENAQNLIYRITELADPALDKECMYQGVFYALNTQFINCYKVKQSSTESQYKILNEFYLDIINKVHYQMPQLLFKEFIIGRIVNSCCFLVPYYPKVEEHKSELEMVIAMGYLKSRTGDCREEFNETTQRIQAICRILFCLLSDDAYIGRLFQLIVLIANFRFHQLSSQILYYAFEAAGKQLLRTYKRAALELMTSIIEQGGYCDKLENYFKTEVMKEIQNKKQIVFEKNDPNPSNTGVLISQRYIGRLKELCKNLMNEYQQRGGNI